jgi:hypothetical protein
MIYAKATYKDASVELHWDEVNYKTFLYGDDWTQELITSQSIEEILWPPYAQPSAMLPPDKVFRQVYLLELMDILQVEWLSPHPAIIAPVNVEI